MQATQPNLESPVAHGPAFSASSGWPLVAALFVQEGGAYYGQPGVDPWPESRDARAYAGPWPVVALSRHVLRLINYRRDVVEGHDAPRGFDSHGRLVRD